MTEDRFAIAVSYGAMILFFVIPLLKIWQGDPFPLTGVIFSIAVAIGFGLFATKMFRDCQKKERLDDDK